MACVLIYVVCTTSVEALRYIDRAQAKVFSSEVISLAACK